VDQHYETIRELRAGNHKLTDKHEFHIVSDETAVIQVYQPVPRDLTSWGANEDQQWIVNAIFQGILECLMASEVFLTFSRVEYRNWRVALRMV
jgi:hypothetical protein